MNGVPSTWPKATGLPGRIAIFHMSSEPSASTAGLTWSSSPTETPPEANTRSASCRAALERRLGRLQGIFHDTEIDHLAAEGLQQGGRGKQVGIVDLARETAASPGITSSSPLANSATRGRRQTVSLATPTEAARPRCCGSRRVPAATTSSPAPMSSPRRRILLPASTAASMLHRAVERPRRPPASPPHRRPAGSAHR